MGKTVQVLAEDKLTAHLSNITSEKGVTSGLILGQRTNAKNYVTHMTVTPLPEDVGSPLGSSLHLKYVDKINELDESWFAEHSRNVTRMLPGGMWVLGIYLSTDENLFQDEKSLNKIKSIITYINRSISENECLYGVPPESYYLVLHYNAKAKSFTSKYLDMNLAWNSADWKFEKVPFQWHRVESSYSLNGLSPYEITDGKAKSIKYYMKDKLVKIKQDVEETKCTVNGVFRECSDTLSSVKSLTEQQRQSKTNKDESFKVFMYSLCVCTYILCYFLIKYNQEEDLPSKVVVHMAFGEMIYDGIVGSQVFLHQNATVEEAVLAVKQDVVRSLAARLEMHWDSFDEGDNKLEGKFVQEPPRRILYKDENSGISFSDYMYKDETCEDVAVNLQEQLGISVSSLDLNANFEIPYCGKVLPTKTSSSDLSGSTQVEPAQKANSSILIYGIVGAAIILIISLSAKIFL